MSDPSFEITSARHVALAASPALSLEVVVATDAARTLQSILLRAQIRIEPRGRAYDGREKERLSELFGGPTLFDLGAKPLLWSNVVAVVPSFTGSTRIELELPCTYDMRVGAAKYFHALDGGEAPIVALFSGTVFEADAGGALRASPLSWSSEARFAVPADVWRRAIDAFYPDSAGIVVGRELFERLDARRRDAGAPSLDALLEAMLDGRR